MYLPVNPKFTIEPIAETPSGWTSLLIFDATILIVLAFYSDEVLHKISRKLDLLFSLRCPMCKRRKNPYKGLLNLVGGKIELGEKGLATAYRELFEETGISNKDIILTHLMDFICHISDCYVKVYEI